MMTINDVFPKKKKNEVEAEELVDKCANGKESNRSRIIEEKILAIATSN